jgi:transcriptional regulator EpsA
VDPVIILGKAEQEYLLRIIEASVQVREPGQFFLWSQGQLQALLPHQLMVCMHFNEDGSVHRLEALHASPQGEAALASLCDPQAGLAVRLARHCLASDALPCMAQLDQPLSERALAPFQRELAACGYDSLLLDSSGRLPGGATVFALFGLPHGPSPRHAYFMTLLLPHLHLALCRLARPAPRPAAAGVAGRGGRALSAREAQIMHWLRAGKRNDEIGQILGLSALTVKNHLQRMYKLLGVRNRGEAVARCSNLRLSADQSAPVIAEA